MKIIRLVSDQVSQDQQFKSRFTKACSAPIIFNPYSKISLKSLSFELSHTNDFIVDNNLYALAYSTGDKAENIYIFKNIIIPQNTYNITTFMDQLQYLMNASLSSLSFTSNDFGFEWSLTFENNKLMMSYGRSANSPVLPADMTLLNMTSTNNIYAKTNIPDSGTIDAYSQNKNYVCRGGLSISAEIGGDPTQSVFYFGLAPTLYNTQTQLTLDGTNFTVAIIRNANYLGNYCVQIRQELYRRQI